MNSKSKKLILDFSKYEQKKITFESDLPLYIGILNSPELNEDWILNFTINNISYSLNFINDTFFQKVNMNDTLIIEKPDKNIHAYIKTMYNYSIETFRPLITISPGIFVFDRNITEEYNTLIYIERYTHYGKYSLFYGNPYDYDFNQLIDYEYVLPINPYKYLKEDDKINYFFLVYENYSKTGGLNIIKLRETKIILNKLHYVENYENERMRLKLPIATDDHKYVFIQYFDEELDLFSERTKYGTLDDGKDFRIYYINKDKEYYADNERTLAYKSYFYISYINYTKNLHYYENIEYGCNFKIEKVNISDSKAIIDFQNFCSSSIYNYSVFIRYNFANYDKYSPLKQYLEKDINNNTKYYEFQKNGSGTFEISDSFKQGTIFVSVVGQDTEGFKRLVYAGTRYNYRIKEEESNNPTIIIIVSVIGAICLFVIIICIIRFVRKKNMDENLKDEKNINLFNEKNGKESADFKDNEKEIDDYKDYGEKAYFEDN